MSGFGSRFGQGFGQFAGGFGQGFRQGFGQGFRGFRQGFGQGFGQEFVAKDFGKDFGRFSPDVFFSSCFIVKKNAEEKSVPKSLPDPRILVLFPQTCFFHCVLSSKKR